jgi:MYND finger
VEGGIKLLKDASASGYVRASYALGLVLRDSKAEEAVQYMKVAANAGYLPALQELLPAREMKAKYGEPCADELRRHLDPLCLNRLLSRYYVKNAELRDLNTSHCWNPLCGRWAFKATMHANGSTSARNRHPLHRQFLNAITGGSSGGGGGSGNSGSSAGSSGNNGASSGGLASALGFGGGGDAESEVARPPADIRVSRMKMCSRCCRAKYCSKLCQVYDWRSGRHKIECQFL